MFTFEANKTYTFGWIGDSELKSELIVTRRTEKNVWISRHGKDPVRKKIHVGSEGEYIYPEGSYSMAPICDAKRVKIEEAPVQAEAAPVEEVKPVETSTEEAPREYEGTEAEVRATIAEEDITAMEEEGRITIGRTMYGTITVQRLFGRKYQAVSESIDFTTADRAVFATFLATVYVRQTA